MNDEEFALNEIPATSDASPVCNLDYLTQWTSGNKTMMRKIMESFLNEIVVELKEIQDAISEKNYELIARLAHKNKTTISIMGVSSLIPILKKMEELANNQGDIEEIMQLNEKINLISQKAIDEVNCIKYQFE